MINDFLQISGFVPGSMPVRHGFFGRRGGQSAGVYGTLNCGLATDDPYATKNRVQVAHTMGVDPSRLQTVYQVHGAECVYISDKMSGAGTGERPRADAMVTDVPGVALGILTADCAPVLFYAPRRGAAEVPIIGAAHAGWKGALGGVLESTVAMMCDYGAHLPDLRAAVGPCIAWKSYEVSAGFDGPFLQRDPADELFFKTIGKSDKLLFDLSGYISKRLSACGVRRISLSDVDTVTNEAEYFSYRRATLTGAADNGRQISVIAIV